MKNQCHSHRVTVSSTSFMQAGRARRPARQLDAGRLSLMELLEARTLLSTYQVNDAGDADLSSLVSGRLTLRQAIQEANAGPGSDVITFNMQYPSSGSLTIHPVTQLPALTEAVTIDGTSQDGYAGAPLITIDGAGQATGDGLTLLGGGSVVQGLAVVGFTGGAAIVLGVAGGDTVRANYIGLSAGGSPADGGAGVGVLVNSDGNIIGGTNASDANVISGNRSVGIEIHGSNTVVQGNRIGTDPTGATRLDNGGMTDTWGGIVILGGIGSMIGGSTPGAGNLIAGNNGDGIDVINASGPNSIEGNQIGDVTYDVVHVTHTPPLSNGYGVYVENSTVIVRGNVISGNQSDGVYLNNASGNSIQGNLIGTDMNGALPEGNGGNGIYIFGAASDNRVGDEAANTISANNGDGVYLATDTGCAGNVIEGNMIGLTASGTLIALSNGGSGITVEGSNILITRNVIAGNGSNGVVVNSGTGNKITENSIYANSILGIDLGNDGVTLNDSAGHSGDSAPNLYQNFPVLTSAVEQGAKLIVAGALSSSAANAPYTVEIFANAQGNPLGYGQGQTYIGSVLAGSDGSFAATLNMPEAAAGKMMVISATATDAAGNTSEFSQDFTATLATTAEKTMLTVTVNKTSKSYGQANPAFVVSYSGLVNGDTPASLGGEIVFATSATADSGVGNYDVWASGLTSGDYQIDYVQGMLEITPAALTITVDNANMVYGEMDLPAFTVGYSGLVNGDRATSLATAPTLATALASSTVGSYAITASGAADPNYSISYVAGTLSITPAPLTITINDASKVYGQANPAFTVGYSGLVNGDRATSLATAPTLATALASSSVGSYAITASGAADPNYSISYVAGTLSVTPAALTITADSKQMVSGQSLPTLTAVISGLVNGDTAESLTGTLGVTTTATSASPADSYPITPGGLSSANYTITIVPGTLTIAAAPSSSTISGLVYYDLNNNGVKESDEAGIAGVTITLTSPGNSSFVSVSTTTTSNGCYTFSNVPVGTYAITESQPANYLAGIDTIGSQGGAVTAPGVFSSVPIAAGVAGVNYNFGELQNIVGGRLLNDITGNGLSSDDAPLTGVNVTVNLYRESDGNAALDSGDALVASMQTTSGAYAFANLPAGNYYTREVVPSGYVRTAPALSDNYAVTVSGLTNATGRDFDNFKTGCTNLVSNVSFVINGNTTVTNLRGDTHQGDTVTVNFLVNGSAPVQLSFVTYNAPDPVFNASTASQQTIYQVVTGSYPHGNNSITVNIPTNYYQIDFVCGWAINQLGPAGSNIFYSAQNRLISADNGGLHSDTDDQAATTHFWANLGQTLINVLPATANGVTLANWLAKTYPNMYGASSSSSANNLTGKTNGQVASLFLSLYNNNTHNGADAQTMATALNVYASTLSLGGMTAESQGYGFDVTTAGLGAAKFNVGNNGQAFNVANNSTLKVSQLLSAANASSSRDVLYNNVSSLLVMAYNVFSQVNSSGGIN